LCVGFLPLDVQASPPFRCARNRVLTARRHTCATQTPPAVEAPSTPETVKKAPATPDTVQKAASTPDTVERGAPAAGSAQEEKPLPIAHTKADESNEPEEAPAAKKKAPAAAPRPNRVTRASVMPVTVVSEPSPKPSTPETPLTVSKVRVTLTRNSRSEYSPFAARTQLPRVLYQNVTRPTTLVF
jgi:hypothetical protein